MTAIDTDPDASDLAASGVAWDLEPLLGDSDVDAHLAAASEVAGIVEQARGTIASLDAAGLAALMQQIAQLQEHLGRAGSYAGLAFTVDTADAERGALMQRVEEESTAIATRVIFFELEWAAVSDAAAEALLADPQLEFCAYSLRSARRYRPHLLTEPEEKIITEKAVSGVSAWSRLYEEVLGALRIDLGGDTEPVSLETAMAKLYSSDRDERRGAAEAVTVALEPGLRPRTSIFNTILVDKWIDDRLRGYPTWITSRNLANETTDAAVQALVDAATSRYDVPQRYYRLKAKLLGLEQLTDYDRYAPLPGEKFSVDWPSARRIVEESYRGFSPVAGEIVRLFFEKSWIDAELRPGKRGGAFSSSGVPSAHPYILMSYTDRLRDVMTLAHELGHGVHQYLSRGVGYLQCDTPLTTAETASVFGEMLTFRRLLQLYPEPKQRLMMLCGKIEDSFATVFRQVTLTRFEQSLHAARKAEGELSTERINALWLDANRPLHGDVVQLTEGYGWWWAYIGHFIHVPFYCYAYAFGELLVLALVKKYEQEGAAFVPKYINMLAAGGSEAPPSLVGALGMDITDPGFWELGLRLLDEMVSEAETLAK